ncbi:hypothetical protein ACX0G9_23575 [Flavitalea flava]
MILYKFIGDSASLADPKSIRIAIRSVNDGISGWKKESDFNFSEKARIENRFDDEIVKKLEKYTNSLSLKEK